jgi:hypothetical protein
MLTGPDYIRTQDYSLATHELHRHIRSKAGPARLFIQENEHLDSASTSVQRPRIHPIAITDRREIEFDGEALVVAIAVCTHAAETSMQHALRPTGVRFYHQEGEIDVLYGTNPATRLTAERLGALLISYCVRTRIPIPRRADKGVRIEAGAAILTFTLHYAKARAV